MHARSARPARPLRSLLLVTLGCLATWPAFAGPIERLSVNPSGGDVNGGRSVNATDITLVKGQAAVGTVNASNFKMDLNRSGSITATDITLVKGQSAAGAQLP